MNLPEWAHLEEEGHGKSAQIVMAVGEGERNAFSELGRRRLQTPNHDSS